MRHLRSPHDLLWLLTVLGKTTYILDCRWRFVDADFGPHIPDNSTQVIDKLHFTLREIVLVVLSHTVETLQALIFVRKTMPALASLHDHWIQKAVPRRVSLNHRGRISSLTSSIPCPVKQLRLLF